MTETSPSSTNTPSCSPLEQEVLDEYAHLLDNLNKVQHPFLPSLLTCAPMAQDNQY